MTDRDDETQENGPPTEQTKREGPGSERPGARVSEPVPDLSDRLERGASVGRYIVLDTIGQGGMGIVYAAYDPELDRKVAIKLLQARKGDETTGGQAWLLREAQALARLAHPNVTAVHDVGSLSGDRVFLAMELVDGQTLRQWLRERPRTWREILPIMLGAGAGLAAAHAAGLVHRDFKPDNVLVGRDGRVRVMDFGLARLGADRETPAARTSDLQIERRSPLADSLTVAGTVLGTPAYMAPEIYAGTPADARSDQYAFGVALYEALFRTRPYAKDAPRDAPPKPPPELGVPTPLQRVAMRAIALEPRDRFPSLDALLTELAVDPYRGRRRLAIAAVVGAGLAIVVGGGAYLMWRDGANARSNDQLCKGVDRRLVGVWDPAIKQAAHGAFTATKKPYAEAAYAGLERALDKYTGAWTAMVTDSCEASRVRGDQSEEVMALREDCLDQRLADVQALTTVLATADATLVGKGDTLVRDLEPITRCANVLALRAPPPPSPGVRAQLPALTKEIALARVDMIAGRFAVGAKAAATALAHAQQLGYDPSIAESQVVLGDSQQGLNAVAQAAATFAEATFAAVRGRRDDLVAKAALSAAVASSMVEACPRPSAPPNGGAVPSMSPPDADKASLWFGLAAAARVRFGADPNIEMQALESEGVIDAGHGDMAGAVAAHQKALAVAIALYKSADDPSVWQTEEMLAATLTKAGNCAEARPHFERALALRQASVGPDDPDIALVLSNLGACYAAADEGAKASAAFEHALAIREGMYGPTSPALIVPLNNLADYLRRAGDVPTALAMIERAKLIADKVPGPNHPLYHTVVTTKAEILAAAKRIPEARALYDALLISEDKLHSPMLPTTQASYAAFAVDQRDFALAADLATRAIAAFEASGGKDYADLWQPLVALGRAKIALGKRDEARLILERAIAIGEAQKLRPSELAVAHAALVELVAPR